MTVTVSEAPTCMTTSTVSADPTVTARPAVFSAEALPLGGQIVDSARQERDDIDPAVVGQDFTMEPRRPWETLIVAPANTRLTRRHAPGNLAGRCLRLTVCRARRRAMATQATAVTSRNELSRFIASPILTRQSMDYRRQGRDQHGYTRRTGTGCTRSNRRETTLKSVRED